VIIDYDDNIGTTKNNPITVHIDYQSLGISIFTSNEQYKACLRNNNFPYTFNNVNQA